MPEKTEYAIGEAFDAAGLTLTATYSDGSTQTITSGFTFSDFDSSEVGTQTITVTYEGKKTTMDVEIIAPFLTKIVVKTMPQKTEYSIGEAFDATGLTLTATYSDGSTKKITSGFACTELDSSEAGTKTITVTYEGKLTTLDVEVIPQTLTKIAVKTMPEKTEYAIGEAFDGTGLTLTATYSDGSTQTITSGFACTDLDSSEAGTKTITVTCEGKQTTLEVEVIPTTLTKIAVKTMPEKTEYEIGEAFDGTGLTLTATYSDGSTKIITSGFTVSKLDSSEARTQTITVTYEGKKTTLDVEVIPPDNAPRMSLSRKTARAGENVTVTLSIENNPGIVATSVSLTYDPAVLRLVGVENGTLFEKKDFLPGFDMTAIPFTVVCEDGLARQNHTEDGVLATFTFEVLADAPLGATPITISYTPSSTFNMDLDEVGFALTSGSVEVIDRLPGDVNDDGEVNLKDVVVLSRYLSGGWGVTINESNADVNGDQRLDLKDTVLLKRYLSGGWNVELK